MPANNFLADNPKAKPTGKGQDDEPVIKWTEPVLENKTAAAKNADGFFDMFAGTDEKSNADKSLEIKKDSDFENKKQLLHEYDSALSKEKNSKNMPEAKKFKKTKDIDRPWTLKTNLIKEEVTTFVNWRKNIVITLLGLVFTVLTIGGAYSSLVYKEYNAEKEEKILSAEITDLEARVGAAKKNIAEADDFQKRLILTAGLLDNHIYWSEFFRFIEENTLENTFYSGTFSGDTKSSFKFSVSTNSYQDVDNQLRIFKANPLVKSVSVSSASFLDNQSEKAGGKISYDLEISLLPDVFKKK